MLCVQFEHEIIDGNPPCGRLGWCEVSDLTGNGLPDVIVGGMGASPSVSMGGKDISLRALPGFDGVIAAVETNVFWYENPGWERHELASESGLHLGVGSTMHDIDGDGRVDLVVGQGYGHSDLYWYRQPADPREPWTQHVISDRFQKYHDLTVGDVDDDGEPELVGLSQEAETVFYYDIPADPTGEPWSDDNCTIVDDTVSVEGVHVSDIDGDGETELVAGPFVYRRDSGTWTREKFAMGWDDVRIAVGDVDGDGEPEVVVSEGDSPTYGSHPGRVAWFDPEDWSETVVGRDLFCPHSLQVADLTGDGHQDIFVGEMGLGENGSPIQYLYRNTGEGTFEEIVLNRGVPTHEAKAADLTGNGRLDIVGKSYTPDHHVDVWRNDAQAESESATARSKSHQ